MDLDFTRFMVPRDGKNLGTTMRGDTTPKSLRQGRPEHQVPPSMPGLEQRFPQKGIRKPAPDKTTVSCRPAKLGEAGPQAGEQRSHINLRG